MVMLIAIGLTLVSALVAWLAIRVPGVASQAMGMDLKTPATEETPLPTQHSAQVCSVCDEFWTKMVFYEWNRIAETASCWGGKRTVQLETHI
jgi:hypothetical protein